MQESVDFDSPDLIAAIRIWSGWGQSSWPIRSDSRLTAKLEIAVAERFLPAIKRLEKDFNSSNAYLKGTDLAEVGQLAEAEFRAMHPEVAEEIAKILAWCYTFDWR